MPRTLTAKLTEGLETAELVFADTAVGERTLSLPIPAFADSLKEWVIRPEGERDETSTPLHEAIRAIRQPTNWVVNGLTLPMRYALLVHKTTRIAIMARPPQEMTLLFRNQDEADDPDIAVRELRYVVPSRVIVGIWSGNTLSSGIVLLTDGLPPISAIDERNTLYPWIWANCNTHGQVCWGSTTRPVYGQDGVSNVDHSFFSSIFNEHLVRYPKSREDTPEEYDNDYRRGKHTLETYHEEMPRETAIPLPAGHERLERITLAYALESALRSPWG